MDFRYALFYENVASRDGVGKKNECDGGDIKEGFAAVVSNTGLLFCQDSLLSRFDLLFILLDSVDEESDRKISDHVVRVHQYRDPREADGAVTNIFSGADDLTTLRSETDADGDKDVPMWDDNDVLYGVSTRRSDRLLHIGFVRKYIEVAKCLKPGI